MLVLEFKTYGKSSQLKAVDDAIRTAQFIRNSCIRLWMDVKGIGKNDLQKCSNKHSYPPSPKCEFSWQ